MFYDPHALTIHIDGCALDNPGGPGGIAGMVEYPDALKCEPEVIFQIGFVATTNNRMELRACHEALTWARRNAPPYRPSRIVILTDSMYVFQHQIRAIRWKSLGWTNDAGRIVENPDLWKAVISVKAKINFRVNIEWERGKSSQIANRVDRLAKEAARGEGKIVDDGYRQNDVARTELPGGTSDLIHARGQEEIIRVYRKALVGRGTRCEYKIYFELYSVERDCFTAKHFAYTSTYLETLLHRHHSYRVQLDDNSGNPHITSVIEEFNRT
jgi:ribonuclease HI